MADPIQPPLWDVIEADPRFEAEPLQNKLNYLTKWKQDTEAYLAASNPDAFKQIKPQLDDFYTRRSEVIRAPYEISMGEEAAAAGLAALHDYPYKVAAAGGAVNVLAAKGVDAIFGTNFAAGQQAELDRTKAARIAGAIPEGVVGQDVYGMTTGVLDLPIQVGLMTMSAGASAGLPAATQAGAIIAPAARSAAAGLTTSSAVGSVQSGLQTYAETGDVASAANAAAITGLVTRAMGNTGVEAILSKGGISGVKARVMEYARENGLEGIEEGVDQLLQGMADRATQNPDKPWGEIWNETVSAAKVGFAVSGVANAPQLFRAGEQGAARPDPAQESAAAVGPVTQATVVPPIPQGDTPTVAEIVDEAGVAPVVADDVAALTDEELIARRDAEVLPERKRAIQEEITLRQEKQGQTVAASLVGPATEAVVGAEMALEQPQTAEPTTTAPLETEQPVANPDAIFSPEQEAIMTVDEDVTETVETQEVADVPVQPETQVTEEVFEEAPAQEQAPQAQVSEQVTPPQAAQETPIAPVTVAQGENVAAAQELAPTETVDVEGLPVQLFEGEKAMPAPAQMGNRVVYRVRDMSGRTVGHMVAPHDGTPEGIIDAAEKLQSYRENAFGWTASNMQSELVSTDANGNTQFTISPNLANLREVEGYKAQPTKQAQLPVAAQEAVVQARMSQYESDLARPNAIDELTDTEVRKLPEGELAQRFAVLADFFVRKAQQGETSTVAARKNVAKLYLEMRRRKMGKPVPEIEAYITGQVPTATQKALPTSQDQNELAQGLEDLRPKLANRAKQAGVEDPDVFAADVIRRAIAPKKDGTLPTLEQARKVANSTAFQQTLTDDIRKRKAAKRTTGDGQAAVSLEQEQESGLQPVDTEPTAAEQVAESDQQAFTKRAVADWMATLPPKEKEAATNLMTPGTGKKPSEAMRKKLQKSLAAYLAENGLGSLESPTNVDPYKNPNAKPSETQTDAVHLGDLGVARDTTLNRMDAGRSTGHLGTGTYFVSSKQQKSIDRKDRNWVFIDLTGLNLAKPIDKDGIMLHDGLRAFNRMVFNKAPKDFESASSLASNALFKIRLSLGLGQFSEEAIQSTMNRVYDNFANGQNDGFRTPSTELMQELGFDGIDMRGTNADNFDYGSVIYPPKSTTWQTVDADSPVPIGVDAFNPSILTQEFNNTRGQRGGTWGGVGSKEGLAVARMSDAQTASFYANREKLASLLAKGSPVYQKYVTETRTWATGSKSRKYLAIYDRSGTALAYVLNGKLGVGGGVVAPNELESNIPDFVTRTIDNIRFSPAQDVPPDGWYAAPQETQTALKQRYKLDGTLLGALQIVAQNSKNPGFRLLAAALARKTSSKIGLLAESPTKYKGYAGLYQKVKGVPTVTLNLANIYDAQQLEQALLHEVLHANTYLFIQMVTAAPQLATKKQLQAYKELTNLLDQARTAIIGNKAQVRAFLKAANAKPDYFNSQANRNYYGLYNLDEFCTECMTNQAFMGMLDRISNLKGQPSLYQKFADSLARLFGFEGNPALKSAMTTVMRVVDENKVLQQQLAGDKSLGMRMPAVNPSTDARYLELAKDPATNKAELQRMVDAAAKAAGYRIGPVWHGSKAKKITEFDKMFAEREDNWSFSSSKEVAGTYRHITVDPQKVIDAFNQSEGTERKKFENELEGYEDENGNITEESIRYWVNNANEDIPALWLNKLSQITKRPRSEFHLDAQSGAMVKAYLKMENPIYRHFVGSNVSSERVPSGEPDGYIDVGVMDTETGTHREPSTVYHVNNGNQIKSADPVTYDAEGNIIPLSQRFNPATPDIRYAPPFLFSPPNVAAGRARLAPLDKKPTTALGRVYQGADFILGKFQEWNYTPTSFAYQDEFANRQVAEWQAAGLSPNEMVERVLTQLPLGDIDPITEAAVSAKVLDLIKNIYVRSNNPLEKDNLAQLETRLLGGLQQKGSIAGQALWTFKYLADKLSPLALKKAATDAFKQAQGDKIPKGIKKTGRAIVGAANGANEVAVDSEAVTKATDAAQEKATASAEKQFQGFVKKLKASMEQEQKRQIARAKAKAMGELVKFQKEDKTRKRSQEEISLKEKYEDSFSRLAATNIVNLYAGADAKLRPILEQFYAKLSQESQRSIKERLSLDPTATAKTKEQDIEVLARFLRDLSINQDAVNDLIVEIKESINREAVNANLSPEEIAFLNEAVESLNPIQLADDQIAKIIRKSINMRELVNGHYMGLDEASISLTDKIIAKTGLPFKEASAIAQDIERVFMREATKAKLEALNKLLPQDPKAKKIVKDALPEIVRLSNLGALDEETYYNAIAEKMGLPVFNKRVSDEINRQANAAQLLPEGSNERKFAYQQIHNYIAKAAGLNPAKIAQGYWYAAILSGVGTQAFNLVASHVNVQWSVVMQAITTGSIDGAMQVLAANTTALAMAKADARAALTMGDFTGQPAFEATIAARELELLSDMGKEQDKLWMKMLGSLKYVSRLMAAADILNANIAKESRLRLLAYKQSVSQDPQLSFAERTKAINAMLKRTKADRLDAEITAHEEGKRSGTPEYTRRVNEIMENNIPSQILTEARSFGTRTTYNQKPMGLLGGIATAVESVTNMFGGAGKYLVPFTRIVANVTNDWLDYTPVGAARLIAAQLTNDPEIAKGRMLLQPEAGETDIQLFRGRVLTGALLYTVLASIVLAMDDEDERYFDFIGGGPKEGAKRKQLMATGWRPYSVKWGNTYIPFGATPFAMPLAMIGVTRDAQKYGNWDKKDLMERMTIGFMGSIGVVSEMSFIQGVAKLTELFSQPYGAEAAGGTAERIIGGVLGGFTSPALLKEVEQLFTPGLPFTTNSYERMLARLPVMGSIMARNQPELDQFGNPVKIGTPAIRRFISKQKDAPEYAIAAQLAEKGVFIPVPESASKRDGTKLTDQELYTLRAAMGKYMAEVIKKSGANLLKLTPDEATKLLQKEASNLKRSQGLKY